MKFRHYIGWAACTLMLAACQDDMLEGQLQQQGNYIYTLSGRMDGDGVMSRAQIQLGNEDVDKEHFFWNNGDSISLYQTTEDGIRESVFQISGEYNEAGEGDKHSADFSATIPALAGFKYIATYPSGLMDEESGNLVFEIKKELDFTNATTDEAKAKVWSEYLQRNMFMMAKGELKAGTSNTVGFEHLCSMLRVTYTNETEDVQSLDDICFNGNSNAFRLYYRGFYSFKGGEDGTGLYRNNVFSTWHHIKTTGLKVAPHSSTDFYVLLMPHAFPEDAELNIRFNRDSENEKSVWMPVSKIAVANDSIYAFEAGKRYWFRVTELPDGLEWDKEVEAAVMESSIALNKSMVEAQQDPHAAERIAIYNWASAAGISGENSSFLGVGRYSDSYNTSYHDSYLSSWIINAEKAISAADYVVANFPNGHAKDFNRNVFSFARIWRAVMIAEYSDNFGPCPLGGFQDDAPAYNSVQEVYYHILDELKEAVEEITPIVPTEEEAALDPMFGFNDQKWIRYANSLRLRYAMRLSEVDPDKAREEIEGVNKGMLIAGMPDIARVEERNQWNAWAGIYSREWNNISLSSTMANILTGLGGVAVTEQRPDLAPYTKPMNYMGMRFVNHYASCTDNPTKSFWLDGIPENLDPRALRLYCLPNDQSADNFIDYGSVANHANYGMYDTNGTDNILYPIDAQYTWNYYPYGSRNAWSFNFSFNVVSKAYPYVLPVLSRTFGGRSEGARVWFGPWETHWMECWNNG